MEVVNFTTQQLYSPGRTLDTHWIVDSVGPRAGMDVVEKRKFRTPARNRTPILRSFSP
jgi:hypothetical protein